jgi:hypothetical protein
MTGEHFRATGPVIPLRTSIVVRGAGYGLYSGLALGALAGCGLAVFGGPLYLVVGAFYGSTIGAVTGLVAGLIGGVAFAVAVPCLARHAHALRPAGSAIVPGILAAAWGVRSLSAGEVLRVGGAGLGVLTGFAVLGAVTGALVGPRILYGKQVVAPDAGDSCATGGEGADSPG